MAMIRLLIVPAVLFGVCLPSVAVAQQKLTREQQVRKDRQDFAQNDAWFYDDLDAAIDEAARSKRPLIIVFR